MTFWHLAAFFSVVCLAATSCSWSGGEPRPDTAPPDPNNANACPDDVPVLRFVSYRAEYDTYRVAIDTFNAQNPDMCVAFVALGNSIRVIPIRLRRSASCHPERSEDSQQQEAEMLSAAKHNMRGFHVALV